MTERTGDDQIDREIRGFLTWQAADVAGAPSSTEMATRIGDRAGGHWGWGERHDEVNVGVRTLPGSNVRWSTAVILMLVFGAVVTAAAFVGARLLETPSLPLSQLGHLAYVSDRDVFVADWDGQNPNRVADGGQGKSGCGSDGYWAEGRMWSPDGRYLAYRSPRDQVICDPSAVWTVFLSDPTGHVVASFPGDGWQVAWSPDSTRVATWLDFYPGTKIGIYGLDGERQAVLSVPQGKEPFGEPDPAWSPDGESLLLPLTDSVSPYDATTMNLVAAIWELPIDGSPARIVPADDPRSNWSFTPSPVGDRVAYIVDEPISYNGALVVAKADGSQARELFPTVPWSNSLIWSPTGDRIAFVNQPTLDNGEVIVSKRDLRIVDVASGAVATLVPAPADQWSILAFSPDGDRVLLHAGDGGLWSVNVDGSGLQQLVEGWSAGDWQSVPADRDPTATTPGVVTSPPAATPGPVGPPPVTPSPVAAASIGAVPGLAELIGPWRPTPVDLGSAMSAKADEACRTYPHFPPGEFELVLIDARGGGRLPSLYADGDANATCITSDIGPDGQVRAAVTSTGWGPLRGELDSTGYNGPDDDGYVHAMGRVGSSVESVVVDVPGIGRVTPTMRNGWYLAWWEGPPPGAELQAFTVTAFDASGQQIDQIVERPGQ